MSCEERETYYQFKELKDGNWDVNKPLIFEIDSLDVEQSVTYDISIEITNNIDYPYLNLWLFSEYNENDSTAIKERNEFILADEFGKWKGSGFGSLYQSSHVVMKSVNFSNKRKYDLYIHHGMKDKILHGIEKVGVKIEKSK